MAPMNSPFLTPNLQTTEGTLTILHLRRDHSIPAVLSTKEDGKGYAEGNVVNTRFGSFPHTTLLDQTWGTQIRASVVDTGSRGRGAKKRKRDVEDEGGDDNEDGVYGGQFKEAIIASSGFLHVLPPTPENWTTSLPHRTQVVYTPDYSYILHRIRARPGGALIEAGSGSGSFTHAAARAVFNGYPDETVEVNGQVKQQIQKPRHGRIYTYEYHFERFKKVKEEMEEHGLASIVTATHRDVYNEGFNLELETTSEPPIPKRSPGANAVFLDLPAPWLALPHLTRQSSPDSASPLDPTKTVHICTFSPCIEQAQRTVSALRRHGWIDIEMVEMLHKRIEIRREHTGLEYEGVRGANGVPFRVEDAVERLKKQEEKAVIWRSNTAAKGEEEDENMLKAKRRLRGPTEEEKRQTLKEKEKILYKLGKLVHRSEPELKTHTSYLVFAILPREWNEEDELKARMKWAPTSEAGKEQQLPKSKKQMKRERRQKTFENKAQANGDKVNNTGGDMELDTHDNIE